MSRCPKVQHWTKISDKPVEVFWVAVVWLAAPLKSGSTILSSSSELLASEGFCSLFGEVDTEKESSRQCDTGVIEDLDSRYTLAKSTFGRASHAEETVV